MHEKIIEALKNLNNRFRENHKLKINTDKVRIGRSNSVSYVFEREIAKILSDKFPQYLFLVDYPISLLDAYNNILTYNNGEETKNVQPVYPDILVVSGINVTKSDSGGYSATNNNGQVIALLDLKIDLGYVDLKYYEGEKSNKKSFAFRESNINKAKKCRFNYIVGGYSEDEKIINKDIGKLCAEFPENSSLKRISIICTKVNSHDRHDNYCKIMKKFGYDVILLLEECHPNTIDDIGNKIEEEINKKKKVINNVLDFNTYKAKAHNNGYNSLYLCAKI